MKPSKKLCPKCNIEKDTNNFYKSKLTKNGLYTYCKDCEGQRSILKQQKRYYADLELSRAKARAKYHKNIEKEREQQYKYRLKLRKEVLSFYGGICNCCGEKDERFLSIDHINGGGTKERRNVNGGGKFNYFKIKKLGFPDIYQILCMNCNFAKGQYDICPHQENNPQKHKKIKRPAMEII